MSCEQGLTWMPVKNALSPMPVYTDPGHYQYALFIHAKATWLFDSNVKLGNARGIEDVVSYLIC